jgi:ABC-2 type transport system ATP-binding protein
LPDGLTGADLPPGIEGLAVSDGRVEIHSTSPLRALYTLGGWALERGLDLPDLTVERPSLEQVYLELTAEQ